jgi:hypothetical protein
VLEAMLEAGMLSSSQGINLSATAKGDLAGVLQK